MKLLHSELRLRWVSLTLWCVAIVLIMLLIVAFYPSVRDDPSLNAIYEGLSQSAQGLLGGSDLTSPSGYLSTQVFAFFLPIVVLVFGLARGAASLAGEEEDRTLDLLLAQPVPRWSAYLQKSAALFVGLLLLTLASWLPLVLVGPAVRLDLPWTNTLAVCVQMGLFALALSLWAQAISAASGRRGVGLAVVSAYAFVAYLVYGLADAVSWLAPVKGLSLWRWYLGNDPLDTGFGATEVLVLLLTSLAALAVGTALFARRDLRS
jgi:ABC-2 type transport system permease protein